MGRKKKINDAVSLKAQEEVHSRLSEDSEIKTKNHTKEYWQKEATQYHKQLEEIIKKARFPESYLKEIEEEGKKRGQQLYEKRKKELEKERKAA
jgi:predicted metal-dependent phosphoesterase TrpH